MIIVGPFVAFTANVSDKSAIVSDEWAVLLYQIKCLRRTRMRQKCVFIRLNEVLGNTTLIIFRTFVDIVLPEFDCSGR